MHEVFNSDSKLVYALSSLTLLLRHSTGPRDTPSVQQQHRHPHIRNLRLRGMFFCKMLLILLRVEWNSSGATYIVRGICIIHTRINWVMKIIVQPVVTCVMVQTKAKGLHVKTKEVGLEEKTTQTR